jgi:uncharacterized membrane protein YvlD (DUF360 family)
MKFLLRVALMAVLFSYVFPAIVPGVSIHGGFWPQGIVAGFLFAFVGLCIGLLAALISVGTLGVGFFVLFVLQMFIPAVTLQVMSSWFPERLTVANWESAIVAGLCIWLLNFVLTSRTRSK